MTEAVGRLAHAKLRFDYLPIGLFGSVMGMASLAVAWQLAFARYGGSPLLAPVAPTVGVIAIVSFLAIVAGYAVKAATAFDAVLAEFRHPIAGSLFGAPLISLLLLPIVVAPYSLVLAKALWITGAVGMVAFAWIIVRRWMTDQQRVVHATPAWIIPVVGLLDIPLAMPVLGLPEMHGLMVFALAVGLFFAVPLFTLIFSRLMFEPRLPDTLQPLLLILMAPFAVGYSTYTVTVGQTDLFAQALYMLTLFLLAVLLGQLRYLPQCCPFRISWWAVSFPLAASAVAALRFASAQRGVVTDAVAIVLLALATLVIGALFARTLLGLARGELRTLST